MNAGKAVYGILSANSGVTDLVGTRIFPEIAEQEAATPFIVYQLQSVAPEDTHDGPSKLDEVRFEFLCYADTYDQAADVGVKVRAALDRVSGTYNDVNVESVQFNDVDIEIEYQPRRYSQVLKFTFRIKRDDFTIAQGTPVTGAQLGQLSDVDVDGVTNGQLIAYNSTSGNWEAANDAGGAESLNDLSDVTITGTPTANQALIYNATTSVFEALANFTNRFEDEVERGSANITPFVERAYGVKSDGDGIFIDNQSDTPSSGKVINRKIYYKAGFITDTDVIGDYTLIHTFADDTTYANTESTFEGFRDGDTYGTPPFTLIQTWEEQTAAPAFTGLLNESYGSGAAAAFGTRRLNGNYTGACMTIRRASDGTTTTIGFDGEDIDEAAIITFCTGTTCTVQVWHDQSQSGGTGSGNDATAPTTAAQPTIYTGGALVKEGGRLALDFDGTGNVLTGAAYNQATATAILVSVNDDTSDTSRAWAVGSTVGTGAKATFAFANDLSLRYDGAFSAGTITPATATQYLRFAVRSTSAQTGYVNGSSNESTTLTLPNIQGNIYIGRAHASAVYYDGRVQEAILYNSDKSSVRTDIEGNISGYYQSAKLLNEQYGEGAAVAYSVRQLNRDYTGAALQVERSSDNTTQDIGFDSNGDLDESALTTFCTGTTCTVRTWYDQSQTGGTGSGNDAVQTTHANQPTIYTGGAIVKDNARPCLQYDTTGTDTFDMTTGLTSVQSVFEVLNSTRTISQAFLLGDASTNEYVAGTTYRLLRDVADCPVDIKDGTTRLDGVQVDFTTTLRPNLQALISMVHDSALGNVSQLTEDRSNGRSWDGNMQEIILYENDKSANLSSIESNIGDYFTQNTPLLDTYTGAAAAYSLRKLRSAYSGSAIRVRRASDNTEQDIGFNVFGELDTVSLASFCSGTDGFVKTWYCQSGNANDLTQTTTSKQPQIYDSSTGVITQNGKPILRKATSNASMRSSYDITTGGDRTVIMNHTRPINSFSTDATNWIGNRNVDNFYSAQSTSVSGAILANVVVNSAFKNGSTWSYPSTRLALWNDISGQNLYFFDATFSFSTNGFCLGFQDGAYNYAMMDTQEIIIYESDQSSNRTNIEDNINTFYSIY